jgi:catechol 2,3-dioxygenase-like lactoylglutathione lyase family enzyme
MSSSAPIARFKELCLDVYDGPDGPSRELGRFWAAVTGCEHQVSADPRDPGDVIGAEEGMGIAICPVPEPKTVKHRVHLDIYARSVDDLVARGASVLVPAEESGLRWTVMADPEGGEFCAFLRDELPDFRLHGIVVDCADPEAVARWWGRVFGVEPEPHEDGPWWTLNGVTGDPVLTLDFVPVPEPKTVKNRVHWDVVGDAAELEALGATRLWDMPRWTTLADPEGNEFCVFATDE